MKNSPTLPGTPHQLVSHHIHQLAQAAAHVHKHARTRTQAAYAEAAAPPQDTSQAIPPEKPVGGAA